MSTSLPLSALRAFEAAARTGSFRAAAAELALTPSAVSHAIRRLESDLGVQLFRRDRRLVRLTGEGEGLMRAASRGFAELHRGLDAASARGPRLLRLHCAPSFAAQWLAPRLIRLLADYPGIEVRLAANADYTRFHNDEFDADIVYGVPRQGVGQQGLVVLPLGEETVTPLCAPALAADIRTLANLRRQVLIESDNKQVRWADWFIANGIPAPLPHGLRFDRSFLAIATAAEGLGVALESTRLAERELAAGKLVRPLEGKAVDVRYVGHHLVFPDAAAESYAVRVFAQWLAQELAVCFRAEDQITL
jgi:LysR family glycine cleavage system transcriptional activator